MRCSSSCLLFLILSFVCLPLPARPHDGPGLLRPEVSSGVAEGEFSKRDCRSLVGEDVEIRECLHRRTYGPEGDYGHLEIPPAMVAMIGAELQWLRPLLEPIFELPVVSGLYTRDARWEDGQSARLAAQPFYVYVAGNTELTVFGLELEDHRVRAVEGEIDHRGNGYLRFTYSVPIQEREVIFRARKPDHEVEAPIRRFRF